MRTKVLAVAVCLGLVVTAASARADVVQNDSAADGQRVVFMGGFGETEWFASTFEIPEELVPWRMCRILAWIGPAGISPFTARMWNDPQGVEFERLDILWDSDLDAYQFTGSQQQIAAIDLRWHDLVHSEPRVRVGFRHTEGFPAPPSIAADTDGFVPRMNHVNAVVPQVDRVQRWYTVDDLPVAAQPPGDWVLRLEVVGEDDQCPDPAGDGPGPVIPGEGEAEGGGDGGGDEGGQGGGDDGGDAPPDPGPDPGGGDDPRPTPAATRELRLDLAVPQELSNDENQVIALLGDGFMAGASVTLTCPGCGASGSDVSASAFDVQVRSAQSLTAQAPTPDMPIGDYDVVVQRPDGASSTLPNGVRVVALSGDGAPVIQGVVPNSVAAGSGAPLLVEGIGFAKGALAFLDDVALGDVEVLSSTRLIATVPTALAAGTYDLTVRNPGGLLSPPWPVQLSGASVAPSAPVKSGGGCVQAAPGPVPHIPALAVLALMVGGRCSSGAGAGVSPTGSVGLGVRGQLRTVAAGRSLAEAMAAAQPGDGLSLEAGTWSESLTVDKPVTVYGPANGERAVIAGLVMTAGAIGAVVSRLDVRGAGDLVRVEAGADVVLAHLHVQADGGRGIEVLGGRARIESVLVQGAAGEGILFADAGQGEVIGGEIRSIVEHGERHTGACVAAVDTAGPVIVQGAKLTGCALRGVRVYQSTGVTVSDNDIEGAGLVGVSITTGSHATVQGNRIHGSKGAAVTAGIGVGVDRSQATVRGNTIEDSGLFAVRTEDSTVTIEANRLRRSGQRGVSVSRGLTQILANVIEDHADFGIFIADGGATVDRNQIRKATGVGIWVSGPLPEGAAVTVSGNRVEQTRALGGNGPDATFATGEGIALVLAGTAQSPVVVRGNEVDAGAGNGLAMDRSVAVIEGNRLHTNGLSGMAISGAPARVTLTGNRITGNAGAGIELIASPGALSKNVITGNGGDGLVLVAGSAATMDGDIIEGNGRFGVLCVGGMLTPADARLTDNGLGDTQGCAPPR